jgi:hypothetical protein
MNKRWTMDDWLRAQGSGLRAQGSGLRAQGSGLRAQGAGLRAQGKNIWTVKYQPISFIF